MQKNTYITINTDLKLKLVKALSTFGFYENSPLLRGLYFDNNTKTQAIIIDYKICNKLYPFSYTEYTKEQNTLMNNYLSVYRFIVDNCNDIEILKTELSSYLDKDFKEDKIKISGTNRELTEIDPTIPEAYFEQAFIETYGRESLDKVEREFPIIDINGQTRWVDYIVRHKNYNIAIEKNGETYHHPIITQKTGYQKQLIKQNSLVAYGYKVFRWSLEGMKFKETFREEMNKFFGYKEDFLLSQKLSLSRKITLLHHQSTAINEINKLRLIGEKNFLVVLPTGTGKTEIMISDIVSSYRKNINSKTLILVPSKQLKIDTIKKVILRFNEEFIQHNITIGSDKKIKL